MIQFNRRIQYGTIAVLLSTAVLTGCVAYEPGWDAEDGYWRNNYSSEPYYIAGVGYERYQPAYHYGVETYNRYHGQPFEKINDSELRAGWEKSHPHGSNMDWEHARSATRAAYTHAAQQHNGSDSRGGNNDNGRH